MSHFLATRSVFIFVIAVGLFTLSVRDLSDPDFWWHLRTGQLVVTTRTVPHVDPFSYSRARQPWIAHEWLSEVIFYTVFRFAGKGVLVTIFALIMAAGFLLAYWRSRSNAYIAGLVTVCGALASMPSWGVRPQMFSLLLTSLFLIPLESSGEKSHLLWWLPPLMLLWVNLHGGFAIGIALIAAYLTGAAWEFAQRRDPDARIRIRNLALVMLACLAVIAVNPNGIALYSYPIETLRLRSLQHISEWRSPDFHHIAFLLFFSMLLAAFVSIAFSKCKIRAHELLLLFGTALAGIHTIRHIPIFALVAIPILSRHAQLFFVQRSYARSLFVSRDKPSFNVKAFNAIALLFVMVFTTVHVYRTIRQLDDREARNFPSAAASFLASRHVPMPLFNHYDWGGYLIWRLYPDYRVWVDGRTDLYGDAFLESFLRIYWAQPGWQRQLDNNRIQSVIVPSSSPLARALLSSPHWQTLYNDRQAVIFTRKTPSE